MYWYHISNAYLGENKVFNPRVPDRYYSCEGDIPRICVTDSIFKSVRAKYGDNKLYTSDFVSLLLNCTVEQLKYISKYKTVNNMSIYVTDDEPYEPPAVKDMRLNNEHWFIADTTFDFIGYIDSYQFLHNKLVITSDKKCKLYIPDYVKPERLDGRKYKMDMHRYIIDYLY